MAKFYGAIGYGISTEIAPGVWEDQITEYPYYGDVERNSRSIRNGEGVNSDLSIGNSISVVSDPYAVSNFHAIRYVKWMGTAWMVSTVEVRSPRLILALGGVYNGPQAASSDAP